MHIRTVQSKDCLCNVLPMLRVEEGKLNLEFFVHFSLGSLLLSLVSIFSLPNFVFPLIWGHLVSPPHAFSLPYVSCVLAFVLDT